MTSLVGIYCKDGVVIGTDSAATFGVPGQSTIEQEFDKIDIIGKNIILAGTGQVGLGQRFLDITQNGLKEHVFSNHSPLDIARILCKNTRNDFISTSVSRGQYGALLAYVSEKKHQLCEFEIVDFQPEMKNDKLWFCSMGSAQPITDTFLAFLKEVFWNDSPPNIYEGIFSTVWTLSHAIKYNPGGVNGPIKISVLEKDDKFKYHARIIDENELLEHKQNIDEAKGRLKIFANEFTNMNGKQIPEIPKS